MHHVSILTLCVRHRPAADSYKLLCPNDLFVSPESEHSGPAAFAPSQEDTSDRIHEIADALRVGRPRVYQLKRMGMPVDSVEAALEWRMKRASFDRSIQSPTVGLASAPVDVMSASASDRHAGNDFQDAPPVFVRQSDPVQEPTIETVTKPQLVILNDGTIYDGECDALGKFHGRGKITFACGDTYVGFFSGGLKHGNGTYVYKNQSFYSGHWRNGLKHGKGVSVYKTSGTFSDYVWSAGDIFDGEFVDNLRHGPCEYTWFNGEKLRCVWNNGKCPEWSMKNAEIIASVCRTDASIVPELSAVDPEPLNSSSDSSTSPPPSRRPPVVYSHSQQLSKPPAKPQESRQSKSKSRDLDQNGWFVKSFLKSALIFQVSWHFWNVYSNIDRV
jgi:hypothetical protein